MSQNPGMGSRLRRLFGGGRSSQDSHATPVAHPTSKLASPVPSLSAVGDKLLRETSVGDKREFASTAEAPATDASALPPVLMEALADATPKHGSAMGDVALQEPPPHTSIAQTTASPVTQPEPTSDEAAASPSRSELGSLLAILEGGGGFTHVFAEGSKPFAADPRSPKYEWVSDKAGVRLRLSEGAARAMSGGIFIGSFGVRLPDEIETVASGREISLSVLACSAAPEATRLAVAYSTNEVGNSGWRWFDCGPEWAIHSFSYAVPPMRKGNGDFVGLLPAPAGSPAVEVAAFSVNVA